jgi:hypothetical protein
MAFFGFGKHNENPVAPVMASIPLVAPAAGVHVNALVTETDSPVENLADMISTRGVLAATRVLIDFDSGPVIGLRDLPLDPNHWIVQGMTIPVIVDPANPNNYEIDWSLVPAITDLAAKNDPSLTDPMGARLRTWDALIAAGFDILDMDKVAPSMRALERPALKAELDAEPQAFARQLEAAKALSAPDGYQRGLAIIATQGAMFQRENGRGTPFRITDGKHVSVLSVSLPGQPAYAVLVPSFDHQSREYDSNNPGLPAVVSKTDPNDVRVLWDEMGTIGSGPAF